MLERKKRHSIDSKQDFQMLNRTSQSQPSTSQCTPTKCKDSKNKYQSE